MFLFVLFISIAISAAKKTLFEMEPRFNNLRLFKEYRLGIKTSNNRTEECAAFCVENKRCSLFRVRRSLHLCVLHGNAVYPDPDALAAAEYDDAVFFVNTKQGRCPLNAGYMLLREADMCVKIYRDQRKTYGEADSECQSEGGRLVVLEEELKANATLKVLQTEGLFSTATYIIGLTRNTANPEEFIWGDGRTMMRGWWGPYDPNNVGGDEDCVLWRLGYLVDAPCHYVAINGFICEIVI